LIEENATKSESFAREMIGRKSQSVLEKLFFQKPHWQCPHRAKKRLKIRFTIGINV
jgi:hypothetical protein